MNNDQRNATRALIEAILIIAAATVIFIWIFGAK